MSTAEQRETALTLLQRAIRQSRAGLDPFDPAVFILQDVDPSRARRALELVGVILTSRILTGPDGRAVYRIRAILEADARVALGLDTAGAPVMADEPLASRAVR